VSLVMYELGLYISEEGFLHSHCHENLKSYKHKIDFPSGSDCWPLSCTEETEYGHLPPNPNAFNY
jgi:hypothetical protein